MKILTIDIGTGTQDIYLYDSHLDIENGFKLVLPSPTMIVHRKIKAATQKGKAILLTGRQMGGGPSAWAAEAHARAGFPIYATPEAATTLNDELDMVRVSGIQVVSEEEAAALPRSIQRIPFGDLNLAAIRSAFAAFGVSLDELAAVAVAVFDHGNAPAGISDRQFRFDYLDRQIRAKNSLAAFAFLSQDIPPSMSRLRSVADSAADLVPPLVVMDTAPAAVLGASFDPAVSAREHKIIVNVGNFHTLAFRLGPGGIEALFEHHTGEIDLPKLERLVRALADGSLKHEDVFNDMGHGALVYDKTPLEFGKDNYDIVFTGPRRSLFASAQRSEIENKRSLRPHFAVPFGDMMIAGCFGLLAATAEVLPDLTGPIQASLQGAGGQGVAPWDALP